MATETRTANHTESHDRLMQAVMDFVRAARNDDRLHALDPGSKRRGEIVRDHLRAIAKAYDIDPDALRRELIGVLGKDS